MIEETLSSTKADYLVKVYKDEKMRSYVNHDSGTSGFSYKDIEEENLRNKYKHVTVIHEVGHMLGLSHPGQSASPKASPNSEADYEADPESLMGLGNKLRINDFQKAFCKRISKSMKKRYNKAQGDSSCSNPYNHCQKWIAK